MRSEFNLFLFQLSILLITSCSNDSGPETPQKTTLETDFVLTLGGSKNESAQAVTKTNDGGYAVLGYTQSMNGDVTSKLNESYDYWLLKFNEANTLEWQKTYGGSEDDRGSDLIQTSDGGYAVIGKSKSSDGDVSENLGYEDFWITKLDASGSISWEYAYGFAGSDTPYSIIQTNDNGYLLTGVLDVSASNGQGDRKANTARRHAGGDYWVIKLNANGFKQWSNYYGGTFTDTAYDAIQTEDSGYIIVGSSDSADVDISNNHGGYDFWVIKISNTGELIWEKSFGGSETDEARAISQTSDGNYLVVGDTRSDDFDVSKNNGAADLWVIKITPEGTVLWEKTLGGTSFDVGRSISKTEDNGFLISGSSRSTDGNLTNNSGQNDAWVLKIDRSGGLDWQKTIGGSEIDFFYDTVELNNQTIVAVGDSSSSNENNLENKGFTDLLILKLK
ncbi:hypothetical protein N9551_00875 [Flavobacteriaceae bacterium]|nr:hypothetical protein [Flavobacteriaceae bacterium]MDB4206540.1 hypothetical protein [Flavobacteriaceae bacterium]